MLPRVDLVNGNHADYLLFQSQDAISTTIRAIGTWAEDIWIISRAFYDYIDAPLILDVGANLGAYMLPIAKEIMPKGGVVYAFEPQRIVYYQLCGNIVLNQLDNVFAFNQAVGDYDGEIDIPEVNYATNDNVGAFSFNDFSRRFHGIESSMSDVKSQVPMVMLDSLKLPKSPSLIKIDVEGYELNVFKGGVQFLETHNFPPVLFEAWGFDWFAKERQELFDFVTGLGYDLTLIGECDYLAQHPRHKVRIDLVHNAAGFTEIVRSFL